MYTSIFRSQKTNIETYYKICIIIFKIYFPPNSYNIILPTSMKHRGENIISEVANC